jgi:ribosomal protein L37AE/L43A
MQASYDKVMATPGSLMRPWAMDPEKDGTLTCPSCLGVADYWAEEDAFVCRRCGNKASAAAYHPVATA